MSLHGVAPDRVYSDGRLARRRVSSYLTFPPLPLQLSCNGKGGKAIPSELHPLRRGDRTRKAGLAGPLSHDPPRGAQRRMALTSTVQLQWRYISVALFLESPPADVIRYPRPVEPGLSSWTAFRHCPRGCPAYLQVVIITEIDGNVKQRFSRAWSHKMTWVDSIEILPWIGYNNND